jgi:DNA-binding NarL/FixJ family response regulator
VETSLATSQVRILLVDDHQSFRRFLSLQLQKRSGVEVIGEASDGMEAVRKAEELQPDLIFLDIGIPSISGIEAARRIRSIAPGSKIVFVSQESSPDIVEEAMSTGAVGYIVKADAGSELMVALDIALHGATFLGSRLAAVPARHVV